MKLKDGTTIILELLADRPDLRGGRAQPLPGEGQISALNIPHSSIVFDLYDTAEVTAELLGANGLATENIRHASIVSFTCLKAMLTTIVTNGRTLTTSFIAWSTHQRS